MQCISQYIGHEHTEANLSETMQPGLQVMPEGCPSSLGAGCRASLACLAVYTASVFWPWSCEAADTHLLSSRCQVLCMLAKTCLV